MSLPPDVALDPMVDPRARAAAGRYLKACQDIGKERSFWAVRMFTSLNLFLWHLDAFAKNEDPIQPFVAAVDSATAVLETVGRSPLCQYQYPVGNDGGPFDDSAFESMVSGLFSDVWVGLSDDIYFDETFRFTEERLRKNGVDPKALFDGKVILDGGCGSGKFSAAIARFGASKVIGLDLGMKGLEFARQQAKKVPYGERLDYRHGSLLDIPLPANSVDMVWSNGVIHHTLDYEGCIREFARIIKLGGTLFLYVNGRFGLFELLQDTLRRANADIPRGFFQHYVTLMGVNSGRMYWLMDCLYAPYEYKAKADVMALLEKHGFGDIRQLLRGVASDQIEQVSTGLPFADVKYGEAQLKFLCRKMAVAGDHGQG